MPDLALVIILCVNWCIGFWCWNWGIYTGVSCSKLLFWGSAWELLAGKDKGSIVVSVSVYLVKDQRLLLKVNHFYDGLIAFLHCAIKNHFISVTVKKNSLFILLLLISYLIFYKITYQSHIPRPLHWIGWLIMVAAALVRNAN